jgi:hypothetical protein
MLARGISCCWLLALLTLYRPPQQLSMNSILLNDYKLFTSTRVIFYILNSANPGPSTGVHKYPNTNQEQKAGRRQQQHFDSQLLVFPPSI